MKREVFIERFDNETNPLTKKEIRKILNDSIESIRDNNPRGTHIKVISMEELAELTQAITKDMRGKLDDVNLLEEMADVYLVLQYLQNIYDISDESLLRAASVKAKRIQEVLDKGE